LRAFCFKSDGTVFHHSSNFLTMLPSYLAKVNKPFDFFELISP
jgi:hypothetical protein